MGSNQYIATNGRAHGTIDIIGSKSISQRAIWAATLANGTSEILNYSSCQDVNTLLDIIVKLGAEVETSPNKILITGITNYVDRDYNNLLVYCNESGFCLRSALPILAANGSYIMISGKQSLMTRNIGKEINEIGYCVNYINTEYKYSIVDALKPEILNFENPDSSQLISGLLYALPLLKYESIIKINNPVSMPYIKMTIDVLKSFNINIESKLSTEYYISGSQKYIPTKYIVEGDFSGAAFFAVAAAISGELELYNISITSIQGDKSILKILKSVGADVVSTENSIIIKRNKLLAFKYDATHTPDLFPPLIVLACNCDGISSIKGVNRLLEKESNRRDALITEFSKLGAKIKYMGDEMIIEGTLLSGAEVDSNNDHRIAMALAISALNSRGNVLINNADSVNKSYPDFYKQLELIKR